MAPTLDHRVKLQLLAGAAARELLQIPVQDAKHTIQLKLQATECFLRQLRELVREMP